MSELRRMFLIVLSISLSCAVFGLIWGARLPAAEKFNQWYWGCVAVFLAVLISLMIVVFRGGFEKSGWPVLLGLLLGYISAFLAYLIFFGIFVNMKRWPPLFDAIMIAFLLPPTVTLSWLFGALTGTFFIFLRYLIWR